MSFIAKFQLSLTDTRMCKTLEYFLCACRKIFPTRIRSSGKDGTDNDSSDTPNLLRRRNAQKFRTSIMYYEYDPQTNVAHYNLRTGRRSQPICRATVLPAFLSERRVSCPALPHFGEKVAFGPIDSFIISKISQKLETWSSSKRHSICLTDQDNSTVEKIPSHRDIKVKASPRVVVRKTFLPELAIKPSRSTTKYPPLFDKRVVASLFEHAFGTWTKSEMAKVVIHPSQIKYHLGASGKRRRIGRGACGDVYLATLQTGDDRNESRVCIKLNTNRDLSWIVREYECLSRLKHSGFVPWVYGILVNAQHDTLHLTEKFGLVMDVIGEGTTLNDLLWEDVLPVNTWLSIALQIAEAVFYIHGLNVTINDIKDDNIVIQRTGRDIQIYMVDFSHAYLYAENDSRESDKWQKYDIYRLGMLFSQMYRQASLSGKTGNFSNLLTIGMSCRTKLAYRRPTLQHIIDFLVMTLWEVS